MKIPKTTHILCCALSTVGLLWSQSSYTAAVRGVVTDASGAALPVWGIYNAHSAAPIQYFQIPTSFTTSVGFNNTAPIAKPTGVAVTIAAVHAALVSYGLIAP